MSRLLLFCCLLALSACASVADKSLQEVRFVTPGAQDALCNVDIRGIRYRVRPPETVKLGKSAQGFSVDCLAPGNRRQKIYVDSDVAPSVVANFLNGFLPGFVWDYGSGAMFRYPDTVIVDFSKTPIRAEDLPAHNNPDIRQPEDYDLEEFRPGEPRLNADRYRTAPEIRRRVRPGQEDSGGYTEDMLMDNAGAGTAADKGNLAPVSPDLLPAMNPAQEEQQPSAPPVYGPPVPLYPGQ